MNLFRQNKVNKPAAADRSGLAELALATIHDGVIMTNGSGVVQFINPAAVVMTGVGAAENALGLDYGLLIRIETKEGRELPEAENPLIQAIRTNQALDKYACSLIGAGADKKSLPIAISVLPISGGGAIIVFRDITKELQEEGEQTEFISTASHEMRTPVATIDGYLSLALNPATATIDERARGYLTSAHNASQHLGKLFRDLLDTTKLEDGRIRPTFAPVELVGEVKKLADEFITRMHEAKINYRFGSTDPSKMVGATKLNQVVYSSVDVNFLREIMENLLDNALKFTPAGGSIYVGVLGDGDRALVNVTDTGVGISANDIQHIFQKFYRADNSDTREIGGTGLGLYIVKQRVEAMGGRIWAESAFGEGTTFYVSLPRITGEEYEKRMIATRNMMAVSQLAASQSEAGAPVAGSSVAGLPEPGTSVVGPLEPGSSVAGPPAAVAENVLENNNNQGGIPQ